MIEKGQGEHHSLLRHSRITTGFTVINGKDDMKSSTPFDKETGPAPIVIGSDEALPIATDNIDLVIASHTLESSCDPHQVLREIDRVLVPEGHCILIGFNPYSLPKLVERMKLSIRSRFMRDDSVYKTRSVARVRDWFSLLGFEIMDVHYIGANLGVRPVLNNNRIFDALFWLDRFTRYAGPLLGNMYVIHAKKQVVAMHPNKKVWRAPAVLSGGKVVLNNTAQKIRRQNLSKQ